MNTVFIIAQLFGLIGLFFSLKAFYQDEKDNYAKNSIFSAIINIIHYLLLNAYSGVVTKVMALIRESLIFGKEKNKKFNNIVFYFIITIAYIVLMFLFYDNSIINLFPLLAAAFYYTAEWFGNVITIKIVAFITTFLWLIYNIIVLSISGIIYNTIVLVTLLIIIVKHYKNRKQNQ